jgi:hypothetical protein
MVKKLNMDRLLLQREKACNDQIEWHLAKGEKHTEKSLRYFRAGFEAGWSQALRAAQRDVSGTRIGDEVSLHNARFRVGE